MAHKAPSTRRSKKALAGAFEAGRKSLIGSIVSEGAKGRARGINGKIGQKPQTRSAHNTIAIPGYRLALIKTADQKPQCS